MTIFYNNTIDRVSQLTNGLIFGELFDYNNQKVDTKGSSYDSFTGNFHILYEYCNNCTESMKNELSTDIFNARTKLINGLDDELKRISDNTITFKRNPYRGNRSSKKIDPYGIEKYIAIDLLSNGNKIYTYMICFETLYLDDNRVNCIIGKLQYYRCPIYNNDMMFINLNNKKEFDCCYPKKDNKINKKKDGRAIYNSEYTLDDINGNLYTVINEICSILSCN